MAWLSVPFAAELPPKDDPQHDPRASDSELAAHMALTEGRGGSKWGGGRTTWLSLVNDHRQRHAQPAFVDHDTDGGEWVLLLSYAHLGGSNHALSSGWLPGDAYAWAHTSVQRLGHDMGGELTPDSIADVRFYAHTSAHERVVHFKTSHPAARRLAFDGVSLGANAKWYATGFTPMAGHTARLPAAAAGMRDDRAAGGLTDHPFYQARTAHWNVRAEGSRWEVDDTASGPEHTTLHQVWVRLRKRVLTFDGDSGPYMPEPTVPEPPPGALEMVRIPSVDSHTVEAMVAPDDVPLELQRYLLGQRPSESTCFHCDGTGLAYVAVQNVYGEGAVPRSGRTLRKGGSSDVDVDVGGDGDGDCDGDGDGDVGGDGDGDGDASGGGTRGESKDGGSVVGCGSAAADADGAGPDADGMVSWACRVCSYANTTPAGFARECHVCGEAAAPAHHHDRDHGLASGTGASGASDGAVSASASLAGLAGAVEGAPPAALGTTAGTTTTSATTARMAHPACVQWTCHSCTYLNVVPLGAERICDVCRTAAAADADVQPAPAHPTGVGASTTASGSSSGSAAALPEGEGKADEAVHAFLRDLDVLHETTRAGAVPPPRSERKGANDTSAGADVGGEGEGEGAGDAIFEWDCSECTLHNAVPAMAERVCNACHAPGPTPALVKVLPPRELAARPDRKHRGAPVQRVLDRCWVCAGTGLTSAMTGEMRYSSGARRSGASAGAGVDGGADEAKTGGASGDGDASDSDDDDNVCPVCWTDAPKYGISTDHCTHFFCEACIKDHLGTCLREGTTPAFCPCCMENAPAGTTPTTGRIGGKALAFLLSHDVVSTEFVLRFTKMQRESTQDWFACPAKCGNLLVDVDPVWEVRRGELQPRVEQCPCGACVCPRCHAAVAHGREGADAHVCPKGRRPDLADDAKALELMKKIAKKCPKCNMYVERTSGCDFMLCATQSHGKLYDAVKNGGCGHSFSWSSGKAVSTYFINLKGERVTGDPAAMYAAEIAALRKELGTFVETPAR